VRSRTELPHLQTVTGAARLLQRDHVPFGVITRNDLSQLREYRVVVVPDALRMDEDEVVGLRSYVEGGGCLYASGRTSLLGTNGTRRAELPFSTEGGAVAGALDAVDLFGMYLLEYETSASR
jgi:hypothetical protein